MSTPDDIALEALRSDLDYISLRVEELREEFERDPRVGSTELWACQQQKYAIQRKIYAIEFKKSRE